MTSVVWAAMALTLPQASERTTDTWTVFPGDGATAVNSQHVHDPSLVQIGGRTFCFSTSGDGFTVVRDSTDLISWRVLGPIFQEHPAWIAERYDHRSIWAPEVVVLEDRVRVYYTASNFGTNLSVIGLAENLRFDPERPLEGWVDRGLVIETKPGDRFNAIDAEVVIGRDGRHWMHFGSYWDGIQVVELNPATGKLLNPANPGITPVARNTGDRGNPIEAAAVLRHNDWYYMFVSYGLAAHGIRSTYRIMVGRSRNPQGPFVDDLGRPMTEGGHLNVLKTSPPMIAPGHNDVLTLSDGRTVMPHHFYDVRHFWVGEHWGMATLQIRELLWDKDGWPLPGLPIEADRPPIGNSPVGEFIHQADFQQPERIRLESDGRITGGRHQGRWRSEDGLVVLTWTNPEDPDDPYVDRVQMAYQYGYYVGRNAERAVVRGFRLSR